MSFSPRESYRSGLIAISAFIMSALLSACSTSQPLQTTNQPIISNSIQGTGTITLTPFQPIFDTQTPTPDHNPSPTAEPTITPTETLIPESISNKTIWVPPYFPKDLTSQIVYPQDFVLTDGPDGAQVSLAVGDQEQFSQWIFALVSPYPTIVDQVLAQDIKQSWKGNPSGPFINQPLLMDENTSGLLSAWWGVPDPNTTQIIPADELLDHAWENQPSWALIPFEAVEPRWKVLEVDGQSPLRKEFDATDYALTIPLSISGERESIEALMSSSNLPDTNRDPNRLTTVALTGVTALVRATAFTMHRNGITYPARDIGEVLRSADLTHISNEIPFSPDCPLPNPVQEGLRFCSQPDYIALLEEVGTDIVELTGDHFGDWGPDAMYFTLDMYEQRDWTYYGGGYDREDARQSRLIEHNGNQIAFIGCNGKGGGYATANDNQPGAVACDFDWLQKEISRLKDEGYQVIATFQHFEYYTYTPQPDQVQDFQSLAKAGAAVVSGSQAHQPQGFEFLKKSFIHYGLGNLFFDQYHFCTDNACDDGFIDRHVFYDGKYLGNELLTFVFEDYARPRLMNPEERAALLQKVFSASRW
jgi:poly-gamma-glutamate synthesis protein (capsule biosynthesis protein)